MNTRAVLVLEVGLVALGVCVHGLHYYQVDRSAGALLSQASEQEEQQHPARAAELLGRYLTLRPDDLEAQARFGLLLGKLAWTPEEQARVLRALDDILRAQGDRQDVRREAVRLAMSVGLFGEAAAHLQALLEANAKGAALMRLQAQCAMGLANWQEAAEWYQRAARREPRDAGLHGEYAALLRQRLGQPARADGLVEDLLRAAPRAPEARLAAARYFMSCGSQRRAAREVHFALDELKSHDCGLLLLAADLAEAAGNGNAAQRFLQEARQYHPRDARVVMRLAHTEPMLRRLIDPAGGAPPAVVVSARRELALTLASRGDYRQFQEALALLDTNGNDEPEAAENERVRGLVLAAEPGHRREALRLLERFARRQPVLPPEVRLTMAELYGQEGNWPQARAHLAALVRGDKDNPVYLAQYVRALLGHGEVREAETWVLKLARLAGPTFDTVALQARVVQAAGKGGKAARLLQSYARRQDAQADRAASLLDDLGHPAEAEQVYRAQVAASSKPERVLPLALHLARHDHLKEALELCEQARGRCPAELVAAASVAALRFGHADAGQRQRVEDWLTAVSGKQPRSPLLRILLAELHERSGRYEAARAGYRRILQADPHHLLALNNLAYSLALHAGKQAEALKWINAAIDQVGPAPELLDTRAVIYLHGQQAGPAIKDLRLALVQEPTAAKYFHLAQAQRLAGSPRDAAEAFRHAGALGLTAGQLPPVEQAAFEQLAGDLTRATVPRR